ncbi:MAG: hypothetical protein JWR50_4252, partial [Mucilaginibacter sp.]|nr:hypothetical protein [Mucilaginibacter sp.]
YPTGFYLKYPEATSFKFNFYIFPLLQLIYMFFNFSAFNEITGSLYIYQNFERILKTTVIIGTCIAGYSVLAMLIFDPVRYLPSFIQAKHLYVFRSSGLSQEPSFYVLYQTWICLFAWYSKKMFSKNLWYFLIAINIVSLIFTFSTTLAGLALILILNAFIFKSAFKTKAAILFFIVIIVTAGFVIINHFELNEYFEYFFISKTNSFFNAPPHTTDSGSFRRYTSGIGLQIFKDNWLTGVGVGNSIYYMYKHEFKMGIEVFGETLSPGTFPQNLFSIVLSEQGAIGGLTLFYFLIASFRKLWRARNCGRYGKMFITGFLFNVSAMLTVAPVYSMFLWVFIALGLNYAIYQSNVVKQLAL